MSNDALILILFACVVCALAALISAVICFLVSRGMRESQRELEARETMRDEHIAELSDSLARLEGASEVEDRHMLRPRDLGGIHEKINDIAQDVANLRGTQEAQYRAIAEQLRILQDSFIRRPYPGDSRG